MDARERLLREIFAKPTLLGHIADWLSDDWTDEELEMTLVETRRRISRWKRARLHLSYPLYRLDGFIKTRWPR